MYLLDAKEISGAEITAQLSDGRIVGPFESERAKQLFERMFGNHPERLQTARDLFEGRIVGDEMRILHTDEMSLETHPFTEVYDIWTKPDNGSVVFELPSGFRDVKPMHLIFVEQPRSEPQCRSLPVAVSPPKTVSIQEPAEIIYRHSNHVRGQMLTLSKGLSYVVCWRADERVTRDLQVISVHDLEQVANRQTRRLADQFTPEMRQVRSRPRDSQKTELYIWERSIPYQNMELGTLERAREFLRDIADDLGVEPPSLRLGRKTLLNHSYYKRGTKEITLSQNMLEAHTVVHEMAHHVVGRMSGVREPAHGGVFAGVLLFLMERHMEADVDHAMRLARERGIVVNTDVIEKLRDRATRISDSLRSAIDPRKPKP